MNLYVLRNKAGQFFKSKGFGGYGPSWREKLEDAKFYTKIGPAKAQVTYWFKNHPQFGCPDLLVFNCDPTNATVLNMESQTAQAVKKGELEKARQVVRTASKNLDWKISRLNEQGPISSRWDRQRLVIDVAKARVQLTEADEKLRALQA